jgi:hypothetical protein
VIITILSHAFPDDPIVGEEDSGAIRGEESIELRNKIVELANAALTADVALGDDVEWGNGPGRIRTADEIMAAIDRGGYCGGRQGRKSSTLSIYFSIYLRRIPQGCGCLIRSMEPPVFYVASNTLSAWRWSSTGISN